MEKVSAAHVRVLAAQQIALLALLALLAGPALAEDGLPGGPQLSSYGARLSADPATASPQPAFQPIDLVEEGTLSIVGNAEFISATQEHLKTLRRTPTGRAILARLEEAGKDVRIVEARRVGGDGVSPDELDRVFLLDDGSPNQGSTSKVRFGPKGPAAVATLGHELIHALDSAEGTVAPGQVTDTCNAGQNKLEMRAIGLAPFEGTELSENRLREELNALKRPGVPVLEPRVGHDDWPALEGHRRGDTQCAVPGPGTMAPETKPSQTAQAQRRRSGGGAGLSGALGGAVEQVSQATGR